MGALPSTKGDVVKRSDCILVYGSTTKGGVVKRSDCMQVYGSTTKGGVVKRSDCIMHTLYVFFINPSHVVDLKERNILVAQKWAELTDEERKVWSIKAEAMCDSSSYQEPEITIDNTQPAESPEIVNSSIIETTLMKIQEKVRMYSVTCLKGPPMVPMKLVPHHRYCSYCESERQHIVWSPAHSSSYQPATQNGAHFNNTSTQFHHNLFETGVFCFFFCFKEIKFFLHVFGYVS